MYEIKSTEGSTNDLSEFLPKEDIIYEIEDVGVGESFEHILDIDNYVNTLEENCEGYVV